MIASEKEDEIQVFRGLLKDKMFRDPAHFALVGVTQEGGWVGCADLIDIKFLKEITGEDDAYAGRVEQLHDIEEKWLQ